MLPFGGGLRNPQKPDYNADVNTSVQDSDELGFFEFLTKSWKKISFLNFWTNYLSPKVTALIPSIDTVIPKSYGTAAAGSNGKASDSAHIHPSQALSICEGRLTLTSGTPVTTADVTGATTIYYTPYKGNRIALYDGSAYWSTISFAETSLSLGTITSGLPYDVFAYNNSETLALELLAWTSTSARATGLIYQNGVLVKSGATTRRYLGTFYTTSTTATEDSLLKRYVYNYYNRVLRLSYFADQTSHNYVTSAWRIWDNNSANKLQFIVGVLEDSPNVVAQTGMGGAAYQFFGLGFNTLSTGDVTTSTITTIAGVYFCAGILSFTYLSLGYNYIAALEYGVASATQNQAIVQIQVPM